MKKLFGLLLCVLFFTFAACSSKPETYTMKTAVAAAEPVSSSVPAQKPYINKDLGFSFAIPDSWERENYTPKVTNKTMEENGQKAEITEVSFIFQGDTENPLLTIQVVPKAWMDSTAKRKTVSDAQPDYLGTKGDVAYRYSLPQACPYDVGAKADLYNSMVLLRDDVPNRFQVLGSDSAPSSVQPAPQSQLPSVQIR